MKTLYYFRGNPCDQPYDNAMPGLNKIVLYAPIYYFDIVFRHQPGKE